MIPEVVDARPPIAVSDALHRQVLAIKATIEGHWMTLGDLLRQIRDERHYENLGHDTFESYLGDPDVAISRSHAYRIMRVMDAYERVGLARDDMATIGVSKLDVALPMLSAQPERAEEWIADARVLSRSDLAERVDEVLGRDNPNRPFLQRMSRALIDMALKLPDHEDPVFWLDEIAGECLRGRNRLTRGG